MEQSQDNELPKIKILGMETDSNGKTNVEFEVCDDFIDYAKFELQKEELTREELGNYVSNLIHKCLSEEDGYSIQKDFKENTKTNIDN